MKQIIKIFGIKTGSFPQEYLDDSWKTDYNKEYFFKIIENNEEIDFGERYLIGNLNRDKKKNDIIRNGWKIGGFRSFSYFGRVKFGMYLTDPLGNLEVLDSGGNSPQYFWSNIARELELLLEKFEEYSCFYSFNAREEYIKKQCEK